MNELIINDYNNADDSDYGQNYDVGHIEPWIGELLPKNYIWYGLGQEALRSEYIKLFRHAEKYGMIVSEEDYQAGQCGKFSYGDGVTTFRFPLIPDGSVISFADGFTSQAGMKINEELPNISGTFRLCGTERDAICSGGFQNLGVNEGMYGQGHNNGLNPKVSFNASLSNPIYKTNGHVKQNGISARLIIKYR